MRNAKGNLVDRAAKNDISCKSELDLCSGSPFTLRETESEPDSFSDPHFLVWQKICKMSSSSWDDACPLRTGGGL